MTSVNSLGCLKAWVLQLARQLLAVQPAPEVAIEPWLGRGSNEESARYKLRAGSLEKIEER